MGSTEPTADVLRAREPGLGIALTHVAALAIGAEAIVLTERWNHWRLGSLAAIAVFAVVSDVMAVESGSSKIKTSGTGLGIVFVAVLLGPAPGALIGMLAVALGWFRSCEAPHYLRNNLVVYGLFPLASGLFFGATT